MYSLIIADDEEGIRNGLAEVVNWEDIGFRIVGLFEDGADVIQYMDTSPVDVVLTDIRMSEVSGLEVAEFVHRRMPDTEVVIISGYQDFEYAKQAIQYNVRQYLLKPTKVAEIRELFFDIRKSFERKYEVYKMKREHEQYKSLLRLNIEDSAHAVEGTSDKSTDAAASVLIDNAKKYVLQNFHRDVTLEHVAEVIYLHPAYLSRLFRQTTGETFSDFLTAVRMKKAAEIMRTKPYKVQDISKKVGYHSTKYFTQVFKKYTVFTPKEYVRIYGNRD